MQWWASEAGRDRERADGAQLAESCHDFFATPGIVSLHIRLKHGTCGIITAADLAAMRPRALLVNTSRAGVIAPSPVEAKIACGRIHADLDVFDTEPLTDPGHPL